MVYIIKCKKKCFLLTDTVQQDFDSYLTVLYILYLY